MTLAALIPTLLLVLVAGGLTVAGSGKLGAREGGLLRMAFLAQVCGLAANQYLVAEVYGFSDSIKFHRLGLEAWDAWRFDPVGMTPELVYLTLGLENLLIQVGSTSTQAMAGFAAFGIMLTGGSFLALSALYAMLGFMGRVLLYLAIRPMVPSPMRPAVLIATTMVPSVVYWCSGIIKESVVFFAGGVLLYCASRVWHGSRVAALPAMAGLYVVIVIKPHFVLAGLLAAGAWAYWLGSISEGQLRLRPSRIALSLCIVLVAFLSAGQLSPRLDISNLADETEKLQDAGFKGGSAYSLGGGGGGLASQLQIAPLALITGLFRPSLLEASNAQSLVSALENTALLLLSWIAVRRLRRQGLQPFVEHPVLVFCVVFVGISSVGVALATGNLGTLSRYRAPYIPAFAIVLAMLGFAPRERAATQHRLNGGALARRTHADYLSRHGDRTTLAP
ncbi:MAG: hypothetical protein R3F61_31765 [Myxococcota bacterium]